MARFVGDTFTITARIYDANGVLTDATTVSVTIRQPDSTNVGPFSMTHGSTGIYTYGFVPTMAGMHTAIFTATGATAPVGSVDLYAYPLASGGSTGLVTLLETKTELRIDPNITTYDQQLQSWIIASKGLIEQRTGPLVARTIVEKFDGGKPSVTLTQPPIVSITSVTETGNTLSSGDYKAFPDSGVLTRLYSQLPYRWLDGTQNIIVTYVAGVNGVWSENIRLANLELLRAWYVATQSSSRPQSFTPAAIVGEDMTTQGIPYYLTPRVEKMLGVSTIVPGIA